MTLKHFVTWKVSIKELEELTAQLKDCPCVSLSIDGDVELIIKRKEAKA